MPKRKPKLEWHYEVTVWNQTNGDVERKCWDITERELDELRDQYEDEPWLDVVIDREWEEVAE